MYLKGVVVAWVWWLREIDFSVYGTWCLLFSPFADPTIPCVQLFLVSAAYCWSIPPKVYRYCCTDKTFPFVVLPSILVWRAWYRAVFAQYTLRCFTFHKEDNLLGVGTYNPKKNGTVSDTSYTFCMVLTIFIQFDMQSSKENDGGALSVARETFFSIVVVWGIISSDNILQMLHPVLVLALDAYFPGWSIWKIVHLYIIFCGPQPRLDTSDLTSMKTLDNLGWMNESIGDIMRILSCREGFQSLAPRTRTRILPR